VWKHLPWDGEDPGFSQWQFQYCRNSKKLSATMTPSSFLVLCLFCFEAMDDEFMDAAMQINAFGLSAGRDVFGTM